MNYKMPGMEIMIPELFTMFDTAKVEIKKEHQVLMVSKTTSFEKGKGKEGNFMDGKPVAAPVKKPKVEPKPETKCFYYEESGR
jgi:hypothetical protein